MPAIYYTNNLISIGAFDGGQPTWCKQHVLYQDRSCHRAICFDNHQTLQYHDDMSPRTKKRPPRMPRKQQRSRSSFPFIPIFMVVFSISAIIIGATTLLVGRGAWVDYETLVTNGTIPTTKPILEVHMSYNTASENSLAITHIDKKNGYVPTYPSNQEYYIQLTSDQEGFLYGAPFTIPTTIETGPDAVGTQGDASPLRLDEVTFSVTVPWYDDIHTIGIFHNDLPVALYMVDAQTHDIKPVNTSTYQRRNEPFDIDETLAYDRDAMIGGNTRDELEIVMVSAGYTLDEMDVFRNDAERFRKAILSYEPFKSRASEMIFAKPLETVEDFDCKRHKENNDRVLFCKNFDKITSVVNSNGYMWDKIIVIVNDPYYGGAGIINGPVSFASRSNVIKMPSGETTLPDISEHICVHEFGHSMGLLEEYVMSGDENTISQEAIEHALYNCAPTKPYNLWSHISGVTYHQGCQDASWYRSSPTSIMRELNARYFSPVAIATLNKTLDQYKQSAEQERPPKYRNAKSPQALFDLFPETEEDTDETLQANQEARPTRIKDNPFSTECPANATARINKHQTIIPGIVFYQCLCDDPDQTIVRMIECMKQEPFYSSFSF